jgi:hypothetical protein
VTFFNKLLPGHPVVFHSRQVYQSFARFSTVHPAHHAYTVFLTQEVTMRIMKRSLRQSACEEILKEGKEKEIDLIVIASLGRSGIAEYLVGSVVRNVPKGSARPSRLYTLRPLKMYTLHGCFSGSSGPRMSTVTLHIWRTNSITYISLTTRRYYNPKGF